MKEERIEETGQYLTFTLDEEVFALEISRVREVLDYMPITRVPRMPEFMRGVINVRGGVVPVLDLRLKLGMTATRKTRDTCIIIVEPQVEGETARFGALADSVQEVLALDPSDILPPPRLGSGMRTEFIRNMARRDDGRFLIILDIRKVFSREELSEALDVEALPGEEEGEGEGMIPRETGASPAASAPSGGAAIV